MPNDRLSPDSLARLRHEAAAKSVLVAYLAWFFVGLAGLHRMYLGRWASGLTILAMLVASVPLITAGAILGHPPAAHGVAILPVAVAGSGFLALLLLGLWWLLDALLVPGVTRRANERLIARLAR